MCWMWQVGGAVKNVIAIAAGMCEGLGLGTNAMAALVTRGCNEMQRLALSLGALPSTLTGESGREGGRVEGGGEEGCDRRIPQ